MERPTNAMRMIANHRIEEQFLESLMETAENVGAGDRDRTGDIQLGKLTFCH
jgi:hypothetical protein